MMYDIMNARVYTNGSASIVTVGTFNPAGLVLFNFSQDIIWPDNSTTVPTDLRINPLDCPFDASEVVDVPWAAVVMGVLTCVVTGIALGLTLIIWRCAWKSPEMYPMYRAEISFDDYMLFATIGIEALQYSAMAPRRQSWWFFLDISRFASLRIDEFTNLRRGYLWLTLEVLYGILLFWALCIVLMRFRVCKKLVCFERHLKNMSGTVLPFVGDLCFLPICHLLLSILHCTQGVGSAELRTTFLQEDCYQTCWEFSHSLFFAFSVLALWGYVALATAVRPEWQNFKVCLHVHVLHAEDGVPATDCGGQCAGCDSAPARSLLARPYLHQRVRRAHRSEVSIWVQPRELVASYQSAVCAVAGSLSASE